MESLLTPNPGTGYLNCEVREFEFTKDSNEREAHIVESAEGKKRRGFHPPENDEHVLAELREAETKL